MCNLTEVKDFFKPKTRQVGASMIIVGMLFWAGWIQFGSLDHSLPIIIAWNLLLGGIGLFVGDALGILLLWFSARSKVRGGNPSNNDKKKDLL